jgi:aminoglycoside/choline kinase family phosphotransferase
MKSQVDILAFAREALGLSESVFLEVSPLEGRGSDRIFFRLRWNRMDSAILIHYDPKRIENAYYVDIGTFLYDIGVPVPRLIRHDPTRCLIAMEDLGDTDLWSFRETPWETRQVLYQKTISAMHRLHCFHEENFPSSRVKLMESFGMDLYRWERDYFNDHFVRGVCGIELEPSFKDELEAELSSLAERLSGTRRSLVHRDLQSQNVMIRDGEPFLIDFQGMRFGSPFYDLGSLLCDPYVEFSGNERGQLLSYYYRLWRTTGGTLSKGEGLKWNLDWEAFRDDFWIASVQRLMQALGAYGFLGGKKGLQTYLEHIPAGLAHLQLAADHVRFLPLLREICRKCQKILGKER